MFPVFGKDFLKISLFFIFSILVYFFSLPAISSRSYIHITGSATVSPFSIVVGEYFAKFDNYPVPVVESIGTGSGIKLFCSGLGSRYPDIVNASRRMSSNELSFCRDNGVNNFKEYVIGYDGIVLVGNTKSKLRSLTDEEIFLALSKYSIKDGNLVPNYYKYWSDINPKLPIVKISVFGPNDNSGTKEVFIKQLMISGMNKFLSRINSNISDDKKFVLSHYFREDGVFIKAGNNSNVIIQKISNKNDAVGIISYSFLVDNNDIVPIKINNVFPSNDSIMNGNYLLRRQLFMYVKDNKNLGLEYFINEFRRNKKIEEIGLIRTIDSWGNS